MVRALWIAVAVTLSTSASFADEQSFVISCDRALQRAFDSAVAMIDVDRKRAHEAFHELAARDQNCAAFHWGLAKTADDAEKAQRHRRDAYLAAAVANANQIEWQKLEELPP
ncbi:MAG TPA: hypothetical protein VFA50_00180 [Stellaceae bacterium]|nr:hypothetical protein [Stellaceae bacterium]